ncbi:MAG: hypothetical protein IKS99_03915, partial [Firmicutes bacterium]|nr:hypothetical protein [Bacillota bacterium]
EQLIRNEQVVGSIPTTSSNKNPLFSRDSVGFLFFDSFARLKYAKILKIYQKSIDKPFDLC